MIRNYKSDVIKGVVALTMLASIATPIAVLAKDGNVNVKVNGTLVNFPDAKPYIDDSNDRTMVPARFVSEALGYQVFWNEAQRKVIIQKTVNGKGFIVTLKEGENKAEVDGKQVTFDAKAVIKDDRTFVPLRFVSESFGADVDWVEKESLVVITTSEGAGAGTGKVPGNGAGTTTPPTGGTGTGTTPGSTPSNGTGTSPSAGVGEKVGADKQFTVVAPSYPDMLMPKDPVTEPAVEAFLGSLKYENGTLTGKIPNLPKGHLMTLTYTDGKDKSLNQNFTKTKEGQSFSIKISNNGGKVTFAIYEGNLGKNDVYITIPEMKVEWGSKR
ncbi:Copper amine oxidase N-terminal domain-containing protein [Brevibacillus sp. IT-7CA2]|uniref:copper amine oxidase N-terminal domain-containing protein n=1 Tax=Brevibacillus sp. IT-7CA2 TaxID=3026436 RepID=UPI0039E0E05A